MSDNPKIFIKTWIDKDFRVVQEIQDTMEQITRRVVDVANLQMEGKIRESLIALGWTPPK